MTRINSAINPANLTDEHLLAEHREIKRLPVCFEKAMTSGSIKNIPEEFKLGKGHVLFFLDKNAFTLRRYKDIYNECLKRGFKVQNYSKNWKLVKDKGFKLNYYPSVNEHDLLIERITNNIMNSNKVNFHYKGVKITKQEAVELLTKQ